MSDGMKLLAAVLETGSVGTLRTLDVGLFLDNEIQVYEFIKRHYRRYAQLPAFETVETETGFRLPEVPERVKYYEKRVRDRKLYGALSEEFKGLRDALKSDDMDKAREQIAVMRSLAREGTVEEDIRDLRQASRSALKLYDDAKASPGISGIPSGHPTLDDQTGGYQDGDLVTWVARMGMGKTYLMLRQAEHAWSEGYSVMVVTMEMTIAQIARRLIGMQAGINPDYIRKGMLSTHAERHLRSTISSLMHTERFNLYAGGFSKKIDDVEVLMQEYDPDIVFIDGIYLLHPESKRHLVRTERVAEVLDALKRITITHNRPIIGTTQFSRQAGKGGREGSLENIGLTDTIGTHSSIVLSIKPGTPPYQESRRVIEVLKGREGEHGSFQVNYKFAPINFDEVPEEVVRQERPNLDYMGAS